MGRCEGCKKDVRLLYALVQPSGRTKFVCRECRDELITGSRHRDRRRAAIMRDRRRMSREERRQGLEFAGQRKVPGI